MIGGWWKYIQLGFYILVFMPVMFMTSLGNTSPVGSFYTRWYMVPFLFLTMEIAVLYATGGPGTGTSIFPFGSHDSDTYPLQKLGYETALVIAIVAGIVEAWFFWTMVTMHPGQVYIPVQRMLAPGFQVVGDTVRTMFSGADPLGNALADSVIPTAIENPGMIYIFMFVWVIVRFVLVFFGVPDQMANAIGMISFIMTSTFVFPLVFHAWSYEHVEVAYYKAAFFTASCTIPMALTGFPIPCDWAHMGHNFPVSYYNLISYPAIVPGNMQVMV